MFRPAFSALLLSSSLVPAVMLAWHAPDRTGGKQKAAAPLQAADTKPLSKDADKADVETAPARQPELSPELYRLRDQVRQALDLYEKRPVNARDHTPWETFHWVLAYDVNAELYTHGPGGETANAIGWLCYNRPCRGQQLLEIKHGRPMGIYGVGLEGHTGQLMAILGQSRVMIDYPMLIKGRQFTIADLVENCKLQCESGEDIELTFLLIGLSHYLHPNAVWKNRQGETWSISRLVREELAKPIKGAACGGTHRLMGLSYAVRKRQQHELPVNGEFRRAQIYVNDYINYALRLQNPDGSLSTEWFTGRGARDDIDRRLQTTGHILEWLVFSVPEERLVDPQIVKAVDYVSRILLENRDHEWKIGHLGHGLRSISLFDRRLFKPRETDVPIIAKGDAGPDGHTPRTGEKTRQPAEKKVTQEAAAGNQQLGVDGRVESDPDPPSAASPTSS
jgi:hypothetical protein